MDSSHLHRINSGCRLPTALCASENNKAVGTVVLKHIFKAAFKNTEGRMAVGLGGDG